MVSSAKHARSQFVARYPTLSWLTTLALLLAAPGSVLVAYLVIGCFEPRLRVVCKRYDEPSTLCRLSERTFLSPAARPAALELESTRFEVERGVGGGLPRLRILAEDDTIAFDTRLVGSEAVRATEELHGFENDPTRKSLELTVGHPPLRFWSALPVAFLLALVPVWAVGGAFFVQASRSRVNVIRTRAFWRKELSFSLEPDCPPRLELRKRGWMRGELVLALSKRRHVLVPSARYRLVQRMHRDMVAFYG